MAETQAELWNDIVYWTAHVVWVGDGRWAHLAKARGVTWCAADAFDATAADMCPPCPRCLTTALAELPLDSCLWNWYRRTCGDSNATPSARWCSTCGAARLRGAHCPRCDD